MIKGLFPTGVLSPDEKRVSAQSLLFGHRIKPQQTLYEYLIEFFSVAMAHKRIANGSSDKIYVDMFPLCDDIYEMLGDEKGSFLEAWNLGYGDIKDELVEITETPANYGITIDKKVDMNRCYVFKSSLIDNQTVHFVDLNADFSLNKTIKDAFAGLDNDLRPNCVSGVNSIVFQIIRLKKRGN